MENAKVTFGKRLRLIRKSRALTLEVLGTITGIGYKHIAAIERGEKVPSFEAIDKLAGALHAHPYEFFLPYQNDETLNQSIRKLLHGVEKGASPSIKRFLIVLLGLSGQIEADSRENS